MLIFRNLNNNLFFDNLYFWNLNYFFHNSFNFDCLSFFSNYLNRNFTINRHFNNFFYDFFNFNRFFNINCLHSGNRNWNISNILNHLNFFHFDRDFNSAFSCNYFRNFNDFFHNLFNYFFNLYYFGNRSINLQNIINIDNIYDLFLYESNDSFIDFWHKSSFYGYFLHFCQ